MRKKVLICAFVLAIFSRPLDSVAAEWFVSAGGSGSGGAASPFGRIQDALNSVQPGDIITVGAGTFSGAITTVRGGTAGAPIRLRAAGPRGSTVVTAVGRVLTINHAYFIAEGLVFDGQYGADDLIRVATAGHYLQLRNIEVRRSSRDLIDMGAPQGVLIENVLVHHGLNPTNGRSDAHGIVAGAVRDLVIRNAEIHTFSGDGIQVDPGRSPPGWNRVTIEGSRIWLQPLPISENGFPSGVPPGENAVDTKANASYERATITIRDTVAFGFRDSAFMTNAAAFNLKENVDALVDRVTVYDSQIAFRTRGPNSGSPAGAHVTVKNAVVHNVHTAFRYEDNIEQLRVANVTIGASTTNPFLAASSSSAGLNVTNLLIFGTVPTIVGGAPGNLGVNTDAFVNAAGGDYHLSAGSLAVDRGVPVSDVTVDRDGTLRPQGSGYDVGAFERRVTSASIPPPPEPNAPQEIALHLWAASVISGNWRVTKDPSAAGALKLWNPDVGARALLTPPADPVDYFEVLAWVEPHVPYRLWMRGRADKNRPTNDSVWVQFSGAITPSGEPAYRIGTSSAALVNIEDCDGCGLNEWGWQDNGYGKGALGPAILFDAPGMQRILVQVGEDGIALDQLVLSPEIYLIASPGSLRRDRTIVPLAP